MKNTQKYVGSFALAKLQAKRRSLLAIIAVIAMIGLSMAACEEESGGSGELTITGLGDYNGKFAMASGGFGQGGLFAADDYSEKNMSFTLGEIKEGKVTLNVWISTDTDVSGYDGSDKITLSVAILNKAEYGKADVDTEPDGYGTVTVQFKDGVGAGAYVKIY